MDDVRMTGVVVADGTERTPGVRVQLAELTERLAVQLWQIGETV
jgi:hypothetical protein